MIADVLAIHDLDGSREDMANNVKVIREQVAAAPAQSQTLQDMVGACGAPYSAVESLLWLFRYVDPMCAPFLCSYSENSNFCQGAGVCLPRDPVHDPSEGGTETCLRGRVQGYALPTPPVRHEEDPQEGRREQLSPEGGSHLQDGLRHRSGISRSPAVGHRGGANPQSAGPLLGY